MKIIKQFSVYSLLHTFLICAFHLTGLFSAKAQYPYVIVMSNNMIGNATIVAKEEIIHEPGFEANEGLDYDAYIDPNFAGSGTAYVTPTVPGILTIAPSDRNYILIYSPQIEGYHPSTQYSCGQVSADITYFDGFGREQQQISIMGSPNQKDFIKPTIYDDFGRKNKDYIPYERTELPTSLTLPSNLNGGQFDESFNIHQKDFVEMMFGEQNMNFGFSESEYEKSPQSRIIKQSAPGYDWALNQGVPGNEHYTEMEYKANPTSIQSWRVYHNQFEPITYDASKLFLTVRKNENRTSNRSITKEYKDVVGRVVLKESVLGETVYRTFYIYDYNGLLRCVVPPKATSPEDQDLCYYYNYDARHRMIEKKVPGAGWVYLVYDKRDRLVMTQDAKMREEASRKWLLNCYDDLDRAVLSGIYQHPTVLSRDAMQTRYDESVDLLNEHREGNSASSNQGYSRDIATQLGGGSNEYFVLTVSYYDKYDFAPAEYNFVEVTGFTQTSEKLTFPRNKITGTKIRKLSEQSSVDWMLSVVYYDNKYRIIQEVTDNPCENGKDIVSNKYSFPGLLLASKTTHYAFNSVIEYIERSHYDHRGRLLEHTIEGLPGEPIVVLNSLQYDPLGQLKTKLIHAEGSGSGFYPFIQKIDHAYNIRGWLTNINDPTNTTSDNDIFAMHLFYNDLIDGLATQKQYNGNISAAEWSTNLSNDRYSYCFTYDAVDRLTNATFCNKSQGAWNHDNSFDEKNLNYDPNGNITSLDRYSENGEEIDKLTYHYFENSNQLNYISDKMGDKPGLDYPGNMSQNQGFYYDSNGNLTRYLDKGINTPIVYNFMNLPEVLDFGNGEKIQYKYDATGQKIAKIVIDGNAIPATSLIYSGNFVYDLTGQLKYMLIGDGRLVPEGNGYRFEYFMKDHLGSTRATYAPAAPGVPQVAEYCHYYPFGMQFEALNYSSGIDLENNYLYNGKELQKDYGLQWLDYGNRFYDPQIGRWSVVDKKAELYFNWSPYTYALNTPINAVDPDGRIVIFVNGYTNNKTEQGTSAYWQRSREVQVFPNGCNNCYQTVTESFDKMVTSHFNEDYNKSLYFDGSLGGNEGMTSRGSLDKSSRLVAGYMEGREKAAEIIQSLERSGGVIIESIRIVAHSMGGAYSKGFIRAIVEYAKSHPEECAGLNIVEYDFASFQQNKQSKEPGSTLYQYDNKGDNVVDGIAGNMLGSDHAMEGGADGYVPNANSQGGHSIFDFIDQIKNLPEGKYEYRNGKFFKVN